MNENFFDYTFDFEQSTPSDAESFEIDYQKIEDCYYNALKRIQKENEVKESLSKGVSEESDLLEFSSDTDATLYTVGVDVAPTTCAQQTTSYILDIRNILLIFLLIYFCITIYSKLKTTLINYTK